MAFLSSFFDAVELKYRYVLLLSDNIWQDDTSHLYQLFVNTLMILC